MTRRVAILGAGIGEKHLWGYQALPERFQVRTICDLDPVRGQALAGQAQAAWTAEMDAVLADDRIDLVDICLPPHLHFDAARRALEAGKDVVCEKPLVTSLAEADQLAETVDRTGRHLFPVFQYRYGQGTAQLRALAGAGLLGRAFVATLETHWNRGADYYAIPWRGTWAGERGGAILGHAIHAHDLMTAILGPVARVSAEVATRVNPIETEDCAALTIRMASGALVTSSVTLGAAKDTSRLRFVFEGATVESDTAPYEPATKPWRITPRDPARQAEFDRVLASVGAVRSGFDGFLDAVADALDGKGGQEVTLADGRRSLEFVTAVYASARSGDAVDLPLGAGHPLYAGWAP